MPELPEVEAYRQLTEGAVGRRIAAVLAPDPHWLRVPGGVDELRAAVEGTVVAAARRRGKVLLVDLDRGRRRTAVVGLHFGMTGRLLLDGCPAVERLEYSSGREDPGWDRFGLRFAGRTGGTLVVRDPRRLGWVELDPDEDVLGSGRGHPPTRRAPCRARHQLGPAEGPAARSAPDRRHRQPPGRRDPLAGGPGSGPPRRRARGRRGQGAPPGRAPHHPLAQRSRRFAHGRSRSGPPRGWDVSPVRDAAPAAHGGRADHLQLPRAPTGRRVAWTAAHPFLPRRPPGGHRGGPDPETRSWCTRLRPPPPAASHLRRWAGDGSPGGHEVVPGSC